MQRDGRRQVEHEATPDHERHGRHHQRRALAPFKFAQEPADSERHQRAKQGDGPAGDGANGALLKQRFGDDGLQHGAR